MNCDKLFHIIIDQENKYWFHGRSILEYIKFSEYDLSCVSLKNKRLFQELQLAATSTNNYKFNEIFIVDNCKFIDYKDFIKISYYYRFYYDSVFINPFGMNELLSMTFPIQQQHAQQQQEQQYIINLELLRKHFYEMSLLKYFNCGPIRTIQSLENIHYYDISQFLLYINNIYHHDMLNKNDTIHLKNIIIEHKSIGGGGGGQQDLKLVLINGTFITIDSVVNILNYSKNFFPKFMEKTTIYYNLQEQFSRITRDDLKSACFNWLKDVTLF